MVGHGHRVVPVGGSAAAALVAGVLVAAMLLAGCAGAVPSASPGPEASPSAAVAASPTPQASVGPWAFTDDRHVEVTLDAPPLRIVAQEDAAAALWSYGIRPIAVWGNAPLADNPQFKELDISAVESVGEVYAEINVEKLAALDPDLIVTPLWPGMGVDGMDFKDQGQFDAISTLAPIVAINATVPYSRMMERYVELAKSLGADLEDNAVVEAQEAYDSALAAFRAAVESKPGLEVMAVSAGADAVYVAGPVANSELDEYRAAGMKLVVGTKTDEYGGYWEALSWENVDKYPTVDVILQDARSFSLTPDALQEMPTWMTLPAVAAGQVGGWNVGTAYYLPFFTNSLSELTELIERSKPLD
jgi:iron complex transport system substrate-binding protein